MDHVAQNEIAERKLLDAELDRRDTRFIEATEKIVTDALAERNAAAEGAEPPAVEAPAHVTPETPAP